MTYARRRLKTALWMGLLLLGGLWLGTLTGSERATQAGVRKAPPKEAFLAGSERSLPILQEISTTLKQIDQRLARIEKIAATANMAPRGPGNP